MMNPRLKLVPVTAWIIIANMIIYILTAILSGNYLIISDSVVSLVSLSGEMIRAGGVWVIFTSIFVHFSLIHLASNMLFLAAFGMLYESKIGRINFLMIYLLSGLAGGVFSLVLFPASIHAGSSAAIFGIVGVAIVRQIESVIFGTLFVLLLFALMPGNHYGFFAHGIGAIVGILIDQTMSWFKSHRFIQKTVEVNNSVS